MSDDRKQLSELADDLAERLTLDGLDAFSEEGVIRGADILDALASVGLTLVEDPGAASAAAYQQRIAAAQDEGRNPS